MAVQKTESSNGREETLIFRPLQKAPEPFMA